MTLAEDSPLDAAAVHGAPPTRVAAGRLIAVSMFERDEGRAAFDTIALAQGGRRIEV